MTANKMPEMPEAVYDLVGTGLVYTADQMRAMYLAGIAAARECVPVEESGPSQWAKGSNDCRELTLANLSALEQGVGK